LADPPDNKKSSTTLKQGAFRNGRDLTTGSIPRHLVAFSLPMLAGNVLQTAYSLINAVWVGKFLGTTALAAVTVSFPTVFVLVAVAGGLTMATNILISQAAGARDWARMRRVVQSATVLSGGLALVILGMGLLFAESLLRLMNTPAEVLPLASHYLRIFLFSIPPSFGFFLIAAMLRGVGDSATPLYFQVVSVGLNAVLDPILMFGWLGMPRLDLNGTAVATVVSQVVALAALLIYIQRKQHTVAPDWRHLRADAETVWLNVKIGLPVAIQQSVVSLGQLFVIGLVNGFGETAVAAFGAAMRIDQVAFLPAMTIGMAVATVAGQNIGANRYARVRRVFASAVLMSAAITLACSALVVSLPGALLRLFINDPEVIALGVRYLHIVGACYVLFAVMFASNGVINGAGHTFITTVITVFSLWIVRVPLATYLSRSLQNVVGVWYAMSASFATSMVISLMYYFSGRWKRPVVRRRPTLPVPAQVAADLQEPIVSPHTLDTETASE
jgi:putative MATE family efflux protein